MLRVENDLYCANSEFLPKLQKKIGNNPYYELEFLFYPS